MQVIKVLGYNRIKILEVAMPIVQAEMEASFRKEIRENLSDLQHGRERAEYVKQSRKPPFELLLENHIRGNNMFFAYTTPDEVNYVPQSCCFISFNGLFNNYNFKLPKSETQWFVATVKPTAFRVKPSRM
jgi:hypothetical protein